MSSKEVRTSMHSTRWAPRTRRSRWTSRVALCAALGALATSSGGCTPKAPAQSSLSALRADAATSSDQQALGDWLAAELFSPGGDAKEAARARELLQKPMKGNASASTRAHLAIAMFEELHGKPSGAAKWYFKALQAARDSKDPQAGLLGEFAAARALHLHASGELEIEEAWLADAIKNPGTLGWGARMRIADAWVRERREDDPVTARDEAVTAIGCATEIRIAGPFGAGGRGDLLREFPAEAPGAWPQSWQPSHEGGETPRVLDTERISCRTSARDNVGSGIFYAETFVTLAKDGEFVFVPDASAAWINGRQVFERDPSQWGSRLTEAWKIRLPAGRHRVVLRLFNSNAWLTLLNPNGTPAEASWSSDPSPGHAFDRAVVGADPSPLAQFVKDGSPAPIESDFVRVVAAQLASMAGDDAAAAVFMQPLIEERDRATGPSLAIAMQFVGGDPIYDQSTTEDRMRALAQKATERDPDLWWPRYFLILSEASRTGHGDAITPLQQLVERYPELDAPLAGLNGAYSRLGWSVEAAEIAKRIAEKSDDDAQAQQRAAANYEERGDWKRADSLFERVLELEPDSDAFVRRALEKRDFDAALKELRRLKKRSDEPDDFDDRIEEIEIRAGLRSDTVADLKRRVEDDPKHPGFAFALADAEYADGSRSALVAALGDSIRNGSWEGRLRGAIDLVEGVTPIEAYRMDAKQAIRAYEAREDKLPGNAVRVIDRAVYWMRSDGFARSLTHELIRVQSSEAISRFAEWPKPNGIRLNLRVIKADGRELEPEPVPGKPTLTFPHLEVGDYIDAEWVQEVRLSQVFRWYFTSVNVGAALSELIFITGPNDKLHVEPTKNSPEMQIEEENGLVIHRWVATDSLPAPEEPMAPARDDYVPNIALWYDQSEDETRNWMANQYVNLKPIDPRIITIASAIVGDTPQADSYGRAQKLYRWVMDNVEPTSESDGRRAITGKSGSPPEAFVELCRALDIDVTWALTRTKVSPTPIGPMHALQQFVADLLVVETQKGKVWLAVGEKWAPFGYVPDVVQGAKALLVETTKNAPPTFAEVTVPVQAMPGALVIGADVELAEDGSAKFTIELQFEDAVGISVRRLVEESAEEVKPQLFERFIGTFFPGARLIDLQLEWETNYSQPLRAVIEAESTMWARQTATGLEIVPPRAGGATQLTTLQQRITPLVIYDTAHVRTNVRVKLPSGSSVVGALPALDYDESGKLAEVTDRIKDGTLHLERRFQLGAMRIAPNEYEELIDFARKTDAAMQQQINVVFAR